MGSKLSEYYLKGIGYAKEGEREKAIEMAKMLEKIKYPGLASDIYRILKMPKEERRTAEESRELKKERK